ncbi:MAG: NAD(P)/FAD-dependent oxidoreductase [Chloroflexi bacterium]|nr:NAD(P)/FAD-dependent oxidoreductase [Chloroflexota bacterium]
MAYDYDAVVVGSGPNGLAAAITLARAGCSVLLLEARDTLGGGMRSAELTLPGFVHDVCSAVHPLALASPFFRSLPLEQYGLDWIHPDAPLAHPLDGQPAVLVERSLDETAARLGADGRAYRALFAPLVARYEQVMSEFLGPLRPPRSPLTMAAFGSRALPPAGLLARAVFRGERARAVFAGMAAHAIMPLHWPATAAFGLMLGLLAHAVGWPVARGGSQHIADALAAYLSTMKAQIKTGWLVESVDELPSARVYLFDVTPRQLLQIAGHRFPPRYRRRLQRYRYGAGAFKVDYALDGPIPWRDAAVSRAGTVHLGGTLAEIAASEGAAWRGEHSPRPFVLLVQSSLFDASRAPAGKHTAWAYCHVPNGSTVDMTNEIEAQIERFAPGFRDRVLARSVRFPADLERYNANTIGGDINGGVQDLAQLFTRPTLHFPPYATPARDIYLCSSSTPPGGGVHGQCGYFAARAALRRM